MSPNLPEPKEPDREPTLAEVAQMAEAAAKTAAEAKSMAEAREGVKQTLEDEAETRGVQLSEEDAGRIADATIAGLEARGVFDETPPPGPPESPPPTGEGAPSARPGNAPSGSELPPPSQGDQGQPAPTEPDNKPRKRTWSERFVGRE